MPLIMTREPLAGLCVDCAVTDTDHALLSCMDAADPRCRVAEGVSSLYPLAGKREERGPRCKNVVRAVGPVWRGGGHGENALLADRYRRALSLCARGGCETVAFSLLGAGAFGYPRHTALAVAGEAVSAFLLDSEADMTVYLAIADRAPWALPGRSAADLASFLEEHYAGPRDVRGARPARPGGLFRRIFSDAEDDATQFSAAPEDNMGASFAAPGRPDATPPELENRLRELDESFSQMLLRKIDEAGLSDAECYKRANVDRKLFSKIRNDAQYRPRKTTAIAFAVALRLSPGETDELLRKAGYALSRSSKFDVIIEYFIASGVYDVFAINEALFAYDQSLLGV